MTSLESTSAQSNIHWLKWGLAAIALIILLAVILANSGIPAFSGLTNVISLKTSGVQFTETELHAQAGQPVNLELFNVDGYAHAFDLDEFGIHAELPGSQTTTVTFTPTEPGTYQFYCGVYGHKNAGMVGTLIVVAP